MRVLVVGFNYAPEQSGVAPYTAALCRGLVARGHRVRILTTMPHYPEWRVRAGYSSWKRQEVVNGVSLVRLGHYVPSSPRGLLRLLSEISFGVRVGLARWGNPDIVVFVSPALFSSAVAIICRAPRQPYVLWVQDLYSLGLEETGGQRGSLLVRLVRILEGWLFRRADGVAVIHDRFAAVAVAFGVRRDRVRVIRNWTHLKAGSVSCGVGRSKRDEHREATIVALHSGAMGKKQHLENVVEAGRVAADRGEDIHFVLMGDGGERARLTRLAAGLPTVSIVDPVPDDQFQDALVSADILIVNEHVGLREMAVPSKLTSYFSSGRPVVAATDAGSVTAEEIRASGGGIRVDPANPVALLDAVLALARDPERAARLGRAGLAYQRDVLSEEVALDRFTDWLEVLLRQHSRRNWLARIRAFVHDRRFTPRR